jgi:hypothetical protein
MEDVLSALGAVVNAVRAGQLFNLIDTRSLLRVDIIPLRGAFEREAARRADLLDLGAGLFTKVATAEDILLAKLWLYRLGGEQSEQQRRDVARLVALNRHTLDDG